ncbi:hypothetical protein PXD04_09065 [Methanosphaera sp. ISO3-F5]|uniref:prenylated flavin chaperone LpdD n=1 Tax=Methanosphaera sp. ISO3-F5 TaxID=1452353 RepID=UPI002B25FA56|nr:hypothetical protein [Methanosphaera sp. ISO3-F5]WQH63838.1 hypothetical protein PXD04_09065 [Methanosphaera sp. ISO3-F5]
MFKFSFGSGNTLVDYTIERVGDDLHISITGGDIHIGGIGLVSNESYNILSVQNHREYELIQPLAKRLTKYEDITILISAGIHVDDITLDEIKEIVENNNIAIDKIDKFICSEYEMFHEFM